MISRPLGARPLATGLALAALAAVACADMTPVEARPGARKTCRPAPGPTPLQCRLLGNEGDWLPPTYLRNVSCRCQTTPNSPTANCVRGRIEQQITAVDDATRAAWRERKRALHDAGREDAYAQWLREVAGPEIYRWHRSAHRSCCCAAPLPDYERWSGVLTHPLAECSSATAIDSFGSCRGDVGRW